VESSTLRFATVSRGDLVRDISLQGRVVASLSPTLFSPGQGFVALRTRAGSEVKRGDILATIDSKELQAGLEQARSQLLTSRAELERQKIVTAQDNVRIAAMELEQARSELALSRETLAFEVATREQQVLRQESVAGELQKRVDDLTIRAPFDGMVATVAVQDRDAVAPNQAIVTVVNLSSLELEIGLPEEYANETAIGTPAVISFLGRDYPGRVTAISPEVVNSQVVARVVFDGPQPQGLKQNQRLTTRLTFESKRNVLKVPRGAFVEAEGGRAAYVVDGEMATRRDITTGATSAAEVEIVDGLREGERIVISDTTPFARAKNVMLR
jgi:HlyD family secretion protein